MSAAREFTTGAEAGAAEGAETPRRGVLVGLSLRASGRRRRVRGLGPARRGLSAPGRAHCVPGSHRRPARTPVVVSIDSGTGWPGRTTSEGQ